MADKLVSQESLDALQQKALLQGALGYANRIADLIAKKTTPEKISEIITADAQEISGVLSEFYKHDLDLAAEGAISHNQ